MSITKNTIEPDQNLEQNESGLSKDSKGVSKNKYLLGAALLCALSSSCKGPTPQERVVKDIETRVSLEEKKDHKELNVASLQAKFKELKKQYNESYANVKEQKEWLEKKEREINSTTKGPKDFEGLKVGIEVYKKDIKQLRLREKDVDKTAKSIRKEYERINKIKVLIAEKSYIIPSTSSVSQGNEQNISRATSIIPPLPAQRDFKEYDVVIK